MAPIPAFLPLPSSLRLKTVEGDMCWTREGHQKEVSAQGILPTGVPMHYVLVRAT